MHQTCKQTALTINLNNKSLLLYHIVQIAQVTHLAMKTLLHHIYEYITVAQARSLSQDMWDWTLTFNLRK